MKNLFSSIVKWAICLTAWFFFIAVAFNISPAFEIEHLGVRIALSGLFLLISILMTYLKITRKW